MDDDVLDTDFDTDLTGETWNQSGAVIWLVAGAILFCVVSVSVLVYCVALS